jgi:hypothetical protein
MARYLVVAHQTAESPELRQAMTDLVASDAEADFVLLVPATPPDRLLLAWLSAPAMGGPVWDEGEARDIAARRAASVRVTLENAGFKVVDARVGDANPLDAIRDQLREYRHYAAIVVSTLPKGVSAWLRMDLISRIRRVAPGYRVVHVESHVKAPA